MTTIEKLNEINKLLEPIDLLADEQPNTCPFDGVRTEQLEQRDEYTVEKCQFCNKLFNFWNN